MRWQARSIQLSLDRALGLDSQCCCTRQGGDEQENEYGSGLGQAGSNEAVGEVVVIPDPNRLAKPAPDENHRDEVGQRDKEYQ